MLYLYNTLNNTDFKSGRYVEFEEYLSENSVNVSKYSKEGGNIVYYPKFYRVRLLHQLSNGYLDLTKDIWTKFLATTRDTSTWFANTNFKYYCPSQYKGKLVSVLEIEDLYKFSLYGLPNIKLNLDNTYKFSLEMDVVPLNPTYKSQNGTITVPKIKFETWYNGQPDPDIKYEYTAYPYSTLKTYTLGEIVYTIIDNVRVYYRYKNATPGNNSTLTNIKYWEPYEYLTINNISASKKDSFINYRITPMLSTVGGTDIYEWSNKTIMDLPDEYINQYKIEGNRKITSEYDNVKFKRVDKNYNCDNTRGIKTYNEYILVNTKDEYLGADLKPSATPFIFLREGAISITTDSTIINSYTVTDRKPVLVFPAITSLSDNFVLDLFKIIEVEENSTKCVDITSRTISITFNIPMSVLTQVNLYQNNELVYTTSGITDSTIITDVNTIDPIVINVIRPGYRTIEEIIDPGSEYSVVLLAFIADVRFENLDTAYQMKWSCSEGLPVFSHSTIFYKLYTTNTNFNTEIVSQGLNIMESNIFQNSVTGTLQSADFIELGAVDLTGGVYLNCADGQCVIYQDVIFNKHVYWET